MRFVMHLPSERQGPRSSEGSTPPAWRPSRLDSSPTGSIFSPREGHSPGRSRFCLASRPCPCWPNPCSRGEDAERPPTLGFRKSREIDLREDDLVVPEEDFRAVVELYLRNPEKRAEIGA